MDHAPGPVGGEVAGPRPERLGTARPRAERQETAQPRLFATSDLHVGYQENKEIVSGLRPEGPGDWLIVAGDVGEFAADIEWALGLLSERFAQVIWAPGNHELWTHGREQPQAQLRGVERYEYLLAMCRRFGVLTPEDPYPAWTGVGGPAVIVPMFLLYDYTFRPDGASTKEDGLQRAYEAGIVATDEKLLYPEPYPSREDWCAARIEATRARLDALPAGTRTVLVNHFPLVREPTRVLYYPEFAQWCGTVRTADWHVRYNALTVVYGHLHIPRTIWVDGVAHQEVSLGYPREWSRRSRPTVIPRQVLPPPSEGVPLS